MASYAVLCFSHIGIGILGQKIGKRALLFILGAATATVGVGLLHVLMNAQGFRLYEKITAFLYW